MVEERGKKRLKVLDVNHWKPITPDEVRQGFFEETALYCNGL